MARVAPCEQRLEQHREVLAQIKRRRGEDAYFLALGKLALTDYWLFLREVLFYDWMDPWFHGEELIPFVDATEGKTRLILIPRGGGKTATITVARPAWWLAKDSSRLIGVANAKEDRARKMARAAALTLENNERYSKCYPHIVPSKKWGGDGYFLDRTEMSKDGMNVSERVDPTIKSFGIRGNVTGSHFSDFINDDPINREMVKYPKQMRVADDFYNESLNCVDTGGNYIINATRWSYHDLYGKLISGELEGSSGRVEVLKVGVTRTVGGTEELIWPQRTFFDRATKKEKTSGYTLEFLESRRKNLGPLFSALYYNEPVVDADNQFDTAMVKTYTRLPFEIGSVAFVGIECESQSKSLLDTCMTMMKSEGKKFRLDAVKTQHRAKNDRIRSYLQPVIAGGAFNMPEHLWRSAENLGEELRTFDKGYDDCLDATAYVAHLAPKTHREQADVAIVCDPAFTDEGYSDFTAICAGCWFAEEFWVLDIARFKTNRSDQIVRGIFRLYDRYAGGYRDMKKPKVRGMLGFGVKRSLMPAEESFEIDMDMLQLLGGGNGGRQSNGE